MLVMAQIRMPPRACAFLNPALIPSRHAAFGGSLPIHCPLKITFANGYSKWSVHTNFRWRDRSNLTSWMSVDLKEKSSTDNNAFQEGNAQVNREKVRNPPRYGVAAVYTGFLVYAFFFAPGSLGDGEIFKILSGKTDQVNDIFFAVFCLLGAVPVNFAALLNAGASKQKALKPEPFVFLSLATGFFTLGPYLIGRRYVSEVSAEDVSERGLLSRVLESRGLAVFNILYVLWCYAFAFGFFTPGTEAFRDTVFYSSWVNLTRLLTSDRGVCVSCIDFVVLSLLTWGPLTEDMKRRGWFQPGKQLESLMTALSFVSLPALGPATYLLLRPRLPSRDLEVPEEPR